jgi:AcrR family transcriptional regulator
MEFADKTNIQKRKKGIETTNRILEISADLFAHRGCDSVSVHEIAKAVGIRESSMYNHFKSKAEILDTLFEMFIESAPRSRPSDGELDKMLLLMMQPEEIFKNVLFYFGSHVSGTLENIAMIINNEKYKNPRAAEVYYKYVVNEPACYYERLIGKMAERGMIGQVDARLIAEQYNYVSVALTKEYFMVKNGLADMQSVVKYMIRTISFFCGVMGKGNRTARRRKENACRNRQAGKT